METKPRECAHKPADATFSPGFAGAKPVLSETPKAVMPVAACADSSRSSGRSGSAPVPSRSTFSSLGNNAATISSEGASKRGRCPAPSVSTPCAIREAGQVPPGTEAGTGLPHFGPCMGTFKRVFVAVLSSGHEPQKHFRGSISGKWIFQPPTRRGTRYLPVTAFFPRAFPGSRSYLPAL